MTPPAVALRRLLVASWSGDPTVEACIDRRIFDRVPPSVIFPYAALGATQVLPDHVSCGERAVEIYQTVHVWSRAVGAVEALIIGDALDRALPSDGIETADGWRAVTVRARDFETATDPDGITTHGVLTLVVQLEPTEE